MCYIIRWYHGIGLICDDYHWHWAKIWAIENVSFDISGWVKCLYIHRRLIRFCIFSFPLFHSCFPCILPISFPFFLCFFLLLIESFVSLFCLVHFLSCFLSWILSSFFVTFLFTLPIPAPRFLIVGLYWRASFSIDFFLQHLSFGLLF